MARDPDAPPAAVVRKSAAAARERAKAEKSRTKRQLDTDGEDEKPQRDLEPLPEVDLERWADAPKVSYLTELAWVADNLKRPVVVPDRCPCASAWHFLAYAREHQSQFWTLYNRLKEKEHGRDDEDAESRRRQDRNLQGTLERLVGLAEDAISGTGAARPFGESSVSAGSERRVRQVR